MLKLHFAPHSRAERVLWLLEELELPYELNIMKFHPEDLKSDEHRKRHPLGRIPVLEDDGISIYESGAIIDYILEKHKNGGLKPSVNSSEYPYYLQWFHFCEGMIAQPMNTIVVHTLLLPPDRRDDVVLGQAKRLASKSLMAIEESLNGKDYLIGSFSGVEFMTGHCCTKLYDLGCVSDEMPNIQSYVKKIKDRPAFQVAINTK
tara:strand:+ start:906 stop:1517 length:612 start_codon:yes stop_codon:yes gene_type:complete